MHGRTAVQLPHSATACWQWPLTYTACMVEHSDGAHMCAQLVLLRLDSHMHPLPTRRPALHQELALPSSTKAVKSVLSLLLHPNPQPFCYRALQLLPLPSACCGHKPVSHPCSLPTGRLGADQQESCLRLCHQLQCAGRAPQASPLPVMVVKRLSDASSTSPQTGRTGLCCWSQKGPLLNPVCPPCWSSLHSSP